MIGQWVRRTPGNLPFHLVDSEVADDIVTRCGRRMNVSRLGYETLPGGMLPDAEAGVPECVVCRRIVDRDGA